MQALRGTQDILPADAYKWNYVEGVIRDLCRRYGYGEIRTPMLEATELFLRGIGDTTDVVTKEMYTFTDRGGRSITLRPENTASAVRAYLEHKLYGDGAVHKLFYIGSMFRYDRPQAGRYREFHQFGVEVMGASSPAADAEVILLAYTLFQKLGLADLVLHINSIGCPKCRPVYREALISHFRTSAETLCEDCRERLEKNPLRVLDCKEDAGKECVKTAPAVTDWLCDECREKFDALKTYLTALGIPFTVDPRLVRGLDYYTNTAFEIQYAPLGAQSAICGGGRYDGLVSEIGGPDTPSVGFAVGLERLLLALESQQLIPAPQEKSRVYIAALGRAATAAGLRIQKGLRARGILADTDLQQKSLKGQMKQAGKSGAAYTVILGDEEMARGEAVVKTMETGEQDVVSLENVVSYIANEKFAVK